jgi:hypothetical protein
MELRQADLYYSYNADVAVKTHSDILKIKAELFKRNLLQSGNLKDT